MQRMKLKFMNRDYTGEAGRRCGSVERSAEGEKEWTTQSLSLGNREE
jgi:hypothetical protein